MHTIFSKIDKKYKIEYWLLLGMNIISTGILTFNVYLEGILLNSLVYKADRAAFVRSIVLITTLSLIRLLLSYFMNKIQILRFREINMEVNDVIMKELYVKDTLAVTKMNSVQTADKITEDTTEVLTFFIPNNKSNYFNRPFFNFDFYIFIYGWVWFFIVNSDPVTCI